MGIKTNLFLSRFFHFGWPVMGLITLVLTRPLDKVWVNGDFAIYYQQVVASVLVMVYTFMLYRIFHLRYESRRQEQEWLDSL